MTSKSKTMKSLLKCAWCGQIFPLTHKGRPKQHKNGAEICVGSGQLKSVHDNLNNLKEKK